ncbi:MAG: glutamate 5-kinase [Firmicutes bacterium]|jgi:glutamate 5-kinase|nr:glutamate 5-kinase [Bacillota bacterium]
MLWPERLPGPGIWRNDRINQKGVSAKLADHDNGKYVDINAAKNVVIKIGTRLLTDASGKLNLTYMENLVKVISEIKGKERHIAIVSSGAIGAGVGRLNMERRPVTIPEKQATAAVGQGLLIQHYERCFARYHLPVAQILLTRGDLVDRQRYVNARNTIHTLLRWGVIPVINENDSVSVEEIKFGDNDRLSSLVSSLIDADLLVILTDIDGLHDADPAAHEGSRLIPVVENITPEIKKCAGNTHDDLSTGGMITKIQAAQIAVKSGINMVIANGTDPGNLLRLFDGEKVGTLFMAKDHGLRQRQRWIAFGRVIEGELKIDGGARKALFSNGKSLLPVGIVEVKGDFARGDLVIVSDLKGKEIGRGLVNYSSAEIKKIMGHPSSMIDDLLGFCLEEEVIHRDNMVIKM